MLGIHNPGCVHPCQSVAHSAFAKGFRLRRALAGQAAAARALNSCLNNNLINEYLTIYFVW
jgi:hypothetical protein